MAKKDLYVDTTHWPRDDEDFHPDDENHSWDYTTMPDPLKYHQKYGNLDRYCDEYEKWEDKQRYKHK